MSSPGIARDLVAELLAAGITDVVCAPGSRSAPILLTLADAERRGLVTLHVRVDERSAGYLALGLVRIAARPVAIVTTSGTAAVNLHPAVVEAAYLGVPIIAITADRPAGLRGSGANQTIDQRELFGSDASYCELVAERTETVATDLRIAIEEAVASHRPLHVNVPLAEPLVAADGHVIDVPVVRQLPTSPAAAREPLDAVLPDGVDASRGLIIVGDGVPMAERESVGLLAETMGWPVICEPSGQPMPGATVLGHGPVVVGSREFLDAHMPDVVVTIGRIGLHRSISRLLAAVPVHIAKDVPPYLGRVDPVRTARVIVSAVPIAERSTVSPDWLAAWRGADDTVARTIAAECDAAPLAGPVVAREVAHATHANDLLVVGASWPIRHLSEFGGRLPATCVSNRGTSGIDGVVSMAWGAALAHERVNADAHAFVLLGDLTALYDRNGLLAAPDERRPRLTYVVIDNDGGGIFSSLEQGDDAFARDFDRVFGTPHDADIAQLLAAPGVEVLVATTVDELREQLGARDPGVRIIVARGVDRASEQLLSQRIRQSAHDALA